MPRTITIDVVGPNENVNTAFIFIGGTLIITSGVGIVTASSQDTTWRSWLLAAVGCVMILGVAANQS
jgi:hypothetical protein